MNKEFLESLIKEKNENSKKIFNFYYVTLISSDTCIDEENCKINLNKLIELKSLLEQINVPKEEKKEYERMVNIGIDIVQKDLEEFRNEDNIDC